MNTSIEDLLEQVREELTHMDVALDGLERNPEGDFIVPQQTMTSMLSAMHEIFRAWNKAHRSFSMVMASTLMHRDETLDRMLHDDEQGTVH